MENFTRRVAGWLLLCLAMSVSLSASAQQPPVERSDVETVPVQDDPEEMVVESRPEDTNRSKSEKEDDTDDDEDEDDGEDYTDWSTKDLKKECRTRGIKVTKGMGKAEMVKALEADDKE